MKGRHVLGSIILVGALVALVLSWPAIARLARTPRVGDWVPAEDPGTLLQVVTGDDRGVALGLGRNHFSCDIHCAAPLGYQQLAAIVYVETDKKLGATDEPLTMRVENTPSEPTATEDLTGYAGYAGNGHLQVDIEFSDGLRTKTMIAPPLDLRRGGTSNWQTLAAIEHLGVLLEWSQTPTHILVRRSALPGGPQPRWLGGVLQVGTQGTQFADETQIATMLRRRVPSHAYGEQNVQITVASLDEGIRTDVRVR